MLIAVDISILHFINWFEWLTQQKLDSWTSRAFFYLMAINMMKRMQFTLTSKGNIVRWVMWPTFAKRIAVLVSLSARAFP